MSETQTSVAQPLIDRLPGPVRVTIQVIALSATVIGGLGSIFGFLSFLARLFWWRDLWSMVDVWAHSLPQEALVVLQWFGWAIHRTVAAYRATVYPYVYMLTKFLPFRLPSWSIDAFFITAFSLVSAWRIRRRGRWIFGEGFVWWRDYGPYLPFWLIAQMGTGIIFMIDRITALIISRRLFDAIYDLLPDGFNDFVFGVLAVSAVLLLFLGIDQVYLLFNPH
jgi:hypothetical protein